jgi:adenosylmethionine-8-amino-7-oxononanoate aminotransferase
MFACEQAGIRPDYLCLSKGLTGGYLPLSVVLTTDAIYGAFYDEYTRLNAFLHSHSYTGNPLACAAANATLAIFREEPVLERNRLTAGNMLASVEHLREHPHVAEIRQCGMILAIELMKDPVARIPWPWQERRGLRIYQHALTRGAIIRPLGTTIYFMPPYIIEPDEIALLSRIATEGIELACA